MLSDADANRVQAAVDGIRVFVDTLILVTDTQASLASAPAGGGSQHGPAAAAPKEQVCALACSRRANVGRLARTLHGWKHVVLQLPRIGMLTIYHLQSAVTGADQQVTAL